MQIFLLGLLKGGSKVPEGRFASSQPRAVVVGVVQQNLCAMPIGGATKGGITFGLKLHARPGC